MTLLDEDEELVTPWLLLDADEAGVEV